MSVKHCLKNMRPFIHQFCDILFLPCVELNLMTLIFMLSDAMSSVCSVVGPNQFHRLSIFYVHRSLERIMYR